MNIRDVTIHRDSLKQALLPQLLGRVFHVSTHGRLDSILQDGAILADPPAGPSYDKAYFRNHGCVSLFDLRSATNDEIDLALDRYNFLNYHGDRQHPAFFLLKPDGLDSIIDSSEDLAKQAIGWQIVPDLEVGYPGDLSLALVDEILKVTVEHPPDPPFLAALKAANGRP